MKKLKLLLVTVALGMAGILSGCGDKKETDSQAKTEAAATEQDADAAPGDGESQVASSDEMVEPQSVVEEGMVPIYGDSLRDGVYSVTVDSSSSMFNITACELRVENGQMTAVMTMGATGYLYVYMGTGEEAVSDSEDAYIPFEENENGEHTFTVPVEALDKGIACSAFSKKKEKWYDRELVFRADSLPQEAFAEGVITTVEQLGLSDGVYSVEVTLEGGSGKAAVETPTNLTVSDGKATATIIWSSSNYDYMVVDGEKLLPVSVEEYSVFEIPVSGFDFKLAVSADTTAMSTPHEIEYTLLFDSATIKRIEE